MADRYTVEKSRRERNSLNVDAYLDRIGLTERPSVDLRGLTAVHRAHLLAIPYENLDVQLRRPVTIERLAIYEKLVEGTLGPQGQLTIVTLSSFCLFPNSLLTTIDLRFTRLSSRSSKPCIAEMENHGINPFLLSSISDQ